MIYYQWNRPTSLDNTSPKRFDYNGVASPLFVYNSELHGVMVIYSKYGPNDTNSPNALL